MPSKRITFIVIPPNDGQVQEYKFSSRLLWLGGLLAVLLAVAFGYYGLHYHTRVDQTQELVALGEQNELLDRSLRAARRDVDRLENLMGALAEQDQTLRDYHEMPPIRDDSRILGVGGRDESTDLPDDYSRLPARKRSLLEELSVRVDRLQREALYQQASFQSLIDTFEANQENLLYVPTIWPVDPTKVFASSGFGERIDPFTGRKAMHLGIDLAGRRGLEVAATADGDVAFAYDDHALGKVVVIHHNPVIVSDDGEVTSRPGIWRTEYGHLQTFLVRKGQRVARGDVIGLMGSSGGRSTGPHLHYAVRYQVRSRGGLKGYKDPRKFLVDWRGDDHRAVGYIAAHRDD